MDTKLSLHVTTVRGGNVYRDPFISVPPPQTISVRLKYWARYSYIEWWGKIVESESRLFRWIKTKSSGEGSIGDLCAAQTLAAGAGCDAASPQGTVVRPCLDSGSAWLADERRGEEVREGWELDGGRGVTLHR